MFVSFNWKHEIGRRAITTLNIRKCISNNSLAKIAQNCRLNTEKINCVFTFQEQICCKSRVK